MPFRADSDVQRDALDELTWDAAVAARNLVVTVAGGVVTITVLVRYGSLGFPAAERRGCHALHEGHQGAHQCSAWNAPGVEDVRDHLRIAD
jgi:osmotically-inducible protein OsmY